MYNKAEIESFLDLNRVIYRDALTDDNFDKLEKLEAFAAERGHDMVELAIAWLLSRRWVGSVIAGATTPEQMAQNIAASDWKLTNEDIAVLEAIV